MLLAALSNIQTGNDLKHANIGFADDDDDDEKTKNNTKKCKA